MSDYNQPYDPSAPEDEVQSRGQYMTRKDLRNILLVFLALFLALIPIYHFMKGNSDKSRCTQNLMAMFDAVTLYATEHDGRYPPIARTEEIGGIVPSLGETGHVWTWASDISGYMSARASFVCPTATEEDQVINEDTRPGSKALKTTYGMYEPLGGYLISLVENPDDAVLFAETSNQGANRSYDPAPFVSLGGRPLPDGFVIGWNTGNDEPPANTSLVTRLAFPDTSNGVFKMGGQGRHGTFIQALTSSGHKIDLHQQDALFHDAATGRPSPLWTVEPGWRNHER